jgi:hypothetical protein
MGSVLGGDLSEGVWEAEVLENGQISVTHTDRLGRPSAIGSDDEKTQPRPWSAASGEEQGDYSTVRCNDKHGDKQNVD